MNIQHYKQLNLVHSCCNSVSRSTEGQPIGIILAVSNATIGRSDDCIANTQALIQDV